MSDTTQRWQAAFQRARASTTQAQADLHRWKQLGAEGADRTKEGVRIRAKVNSLKIDLDKLLRELGTLPQQEATQKSVTQWRDDLATAIAEVQEMQRNLKGSAGSTTTSSTPASTPNGSFAEMKGSTNGKYRGNAELSDRALLADQQQQMRDLEQQLEPLEGTVNTLHQVSTMISREIREQNEILDHHNETTSRVIQRLGRVQAAMGQLFRRDNNCKLTIVAIVLVVVIIVLFVKVVIPKL